MHKGSTACRGRVEAEALRHREARPKGVEAGKQGKQGGRGNEARRHEGRETERQIGCEPGRQRPGVADKQSGSEAAAMLRG